MIQGNNMHNYNTHTGEDPKPKAYRSQKYLKFIRSRPCCVCARKSVAHHEQVTGRGTGIKASDYETIPLCEKCHEMRHRVGKDTFWQGINTEKLIIGYLIEYLELNL